MNYSLFENHKILKRFKINASEICVCKYDIEKMFEYFVKLNSICKNDLVLVPILHINITLSF